MGVHGAEGVFNMGGDWSISNGSLPDDIELSLERVIDLWKKPVTLPSKLCLKSSSLLGDPVGEESQLFASDNDTVGVIGSFVEIVVVALDDFEMRMEL